MQTAMRLHAPHVLGVPVVFTALVAWDRIPRLPSTRRRLCSSTAESKLCAAMLLPAASELFAIYVDGRHGMFVQAQDDADALYVLNGRWGALRAVLPPDSSCLAVVYSNVAGKLVMGVYDVLRLAGVDKTDSAIFERQALLSTLFRHAPRLENIELHWVGMEESLLQYMQKQQNMLSLPFTVANMLRLSPASTCTSDSSDDMYQVVIRPLLMRTSGS